MKRSPALIVCMGVSGCGKTTIAQKLAGELDLVFFEADDFHSEANRAHMAGGNALDDAMRAPWIQSICGALEEALSQGRNCVLACSALRRAYRDRFRSLGVPTLFLFLDGDRDLIAGWMTGRNDHFMPASLLESQFATLESPLEEPDVRRIGLSDDWYHTTTQTLETARNFLNL
jgi:gluconokinase